MVALSGCFATRGDLDRLHHRIEQGEAQIEAQLDRFEAGLASAHDVTGSVRMALEENKAEVAEVARTVDERGGIAWDTIIYAVTAAAGLCVPGSVVLTNRVRDSRRRRRDEPVAVPKAKVT